MSRLLGKLAGARRGRGKLRADWVGAVLALLPLGVAQADTLWVKASGSAQSLELPSLHIVGVREGQVFFENSLGRQSARPLGQVARLHLDDEPAFSDAEDAYTMQAWDKATDAYQRALRFSARPWVRQWSTGRLLECAGKCGRFDAAVTAYITLAAEDPYTARNLRPALPGARSSYLDSAVAQVDTALNNGTLSGDSKQELLLFLMDIQRTRGDLAAVGKVAEQLVKLNPAIASDPATIQSLLALKLSQVRAALEQKNYDKVIGEVTAGRALFTEAGMAPDALFCLAEAQEAKATAARDANGLKEAALTYMGVVVNANPLPARPHMAPSLLRIAVIEEQLNEPKEALRVYQQVVAEFKDEPAARTAQENVQRLK